MKSPPAVTVAPSCHMQVKYRVKANFDDKELSAYLASLLSPVGCEDCLVCSETASEL